MPSFRQMGGGWSLPPERCGNPDLYAFDLGRGGQPHLLIDSERMEDQAAFSPDGKFIYFVSTYSGNADFYLSFSET